MWSCVWMAGGGLCVPTHGATKMPLWFVDRLATHHLVSLVLMSLLYMCMKSSQWIYFTLIGLTTHKTDRMCLRNDGDTLTCCWWSILVQELLLERMITQVYIQTIPLLAQSYSVLDWNPTSPTVLKISMKPCHVYRLVLLQWAVIVSLAQFHHISGVWRDIFPPIFISQLEFFPMHLALMVQYDSEMGIFWGKAGWRSVSTMPGVLCVMMVGTMQTLQ